LETSSGFRVGAEGGGAWAEAGSEEVVVVVSRRARREVVKERMGRDILSCFVHWTHRARGRALFSKAMLKDVYA
jgi:hypothetical protein